MTSKGLALLIPVLGCGSAQAVLSTIDLTQIWTVTADGPRQSLTLDNVSVGGAEQDGVVLTATGGRRFLTEVNDQNGQPLMANSVGFNENSGVPTDVQITFSFDNGNTTVDEFRISFANLNVRGAIDTDADGEYITFGTPIASQTIDSLHEFSATGYPTTTTVPTLQPLDALGSSGDDRVDAISTFVFQNVSTVTFTYHDQNIGTTGSNTIVIGDAQIDTVPEPSTALLGLLASLGLLKRRR